MPCRVTTICRCSKMLSFDSLETSNFFQLIIKVIFRFIKENIIKTSYRKLVDNAKYSIITTPLFIIDMRMEFRNFTFILISSFIISSIFF